MSRSGLLALALTALVAAACTEPGTGPGTEPAGTPAGSAVPDPDLTEMEPQVAERFRETREAVLADPLSAGAWGRFGMVAHAHELWYEALAAYRQAEKLDPEDKRWPYYAGDVLSVVGTDLEAAAGAFRRALALYPDYAPAHMRLGRVLVAAGQGAAAAAELERALELKPDLQPARLTLAQVRLAEGRLEEARTMLEDVLASEPRHAQALSALGQIQMRQGRRDEARAIAERARRAAIYSLFSDPLMDPVVAEGVSSSVIWERAKAFLDNGDAEQAALGLERVVALQPENVDAHQQLAVACGNLGQKHRALQHLERTVALAPERVAARMQLAMVQLELQDPASAADQLVRILELEPKDPDAPWLLGRARLMSGDVPGALAVFGQAAALGGEVPLWARNEWGNALAQSGRPEDALEQFRAALAAEPKNAQALFYAGLVHEGMGRIEEAVRRYCASMEAQPNPGASARLSALGRQCG